MLQVMRTSEEDSGASKPADKDASPAEEGVAPAQSFLAPATHYAYPYSALSLGAGPPPHQQPVSLPIAKTTESIPEPAPLLSAQYEPLSDED